MSSEFVDARTRHFERAATVVAGVSVIALLFLPLYMIHSYSTTSLSVVTAHEAGATVGIGVLLRATMRRIFRTSASNILKTSAGAFSRATTRTFTRRLIRTTLRPLIGLLTRGALEEQSEDAGPAPAVAEDDEPPGQAMPLAVALGFVGLGCSFWGILALITPEQVANVTGGNVISVYAAAALAGAPLILYSLLTLVAAKHFGVEARFNTGIDGLLLQAYFTGAGSYLPMTTDVLYSGNEDKHHWVAALPLAGLFVTHLVFLALARQTGVFELEFASSTFLIYVFVYSFPIKPLEGYDIWARSKLMWALFFAPVLWSFAANLPPDFAVIL